MSRVLMLVSCVFCGIAMVSACGPEPAAPEDGAPAVIEQAAIAGSLTGIANQYSRANLQAHLAALLGNGPRVSAGPVEAAAAEYIAAELESFGLPVDIQPFDMPYYFENGSTLAVAGVTGLAPVALLYSTHGDVTGQLVDCGAGRLTGTKDTRTGVVWTGPSELPADLTGKIALMERGHTSFQNMMARAAARHALAVIVYQEPGVNGPVLGMLAWTESLIPIVGISRAEGLALLGPMATGPVTAHLVVDTVNAPSQSQNVIATLPGTSPDAGVVYVGAHYDTTQVPGANDNGSGVAAMLEAARVLSRPGMSTRATLKFIAFGGEENGLWGSEYYALLGEGTADEVAARGIGMIDLDSISVGVSLGLGYLPAADRALTDLAYAGCLARGMTCYEYDTTRISSDHVNFDAAGVPTVFFLQMVDPATNTYDPNMHTLLDDASHLNWDNLEDGGELATALAYEWAKNPSHRAMKQAKAAERAAAEIPLH